MSSSSSANNGENGNQEVRRELRKEYRVLKDLIHSSHTLSSVPSTEYREYHDKINQLFEHVENIRELGVDADALADLAKAVKGQASKLGDISSAFNFQTFARNLVAQYTTPESVLFNWTQLGENVGCIFAFTPQWHVMHGTMTKEIKEKKKAGVRKAKEHAVTEHLEELSNKKDGNEAAEAEATNGRSAKLINVLKPKGGTQDKKKSIPMLDLLVDTSDPVQTIENFFDFSFLIKSKEAMVHEVDGVLHLQSTEDIHQSSDKAAAGEVNKKQMVMRIDMKDLLKLCVDYKQPSANSDTADNSGKVSKRKSSSSSASARGSSASTMSAKRRVSLTPLHRKDELYAAADAHEQADIIQRRAESLTTTANNKKSKK